MRRSLLLASVLGLGALLLGRPGHTQNLNCHSNVMVLFDRSTSMYCDEIGSQTRWQIATSALTDVLTSFQDKAAFGLTIFPADKRSCSAGVTVVDPESGAKLLTDASAALSAYPSGFGLYTPIGQTLSQVTSMAGMLDSTSRRYVILVTDGAESCPNASDVESRDTITATVKALKAAGITTYVVGFGEKNITVAPISGCTAAAIDPIDTILLNEIAVAGGTAKSGCDPSTTDSTSSSNCFYPAADGPALVQALGAIAIEISTEVCDGIDNNCNGLIDEGLTRPCSTTCGTGTEHCDMGQWVGCTAPQPVLDMCTNAPTCDTPPTTCGCNDGDTMPCGLDVGECTPGTSTCVDHAWGPCVGGTGPTDGSECDGKDHNCNGVIDNGGCQCAPGSTQICGGPDVGQCKTGTQTCDANGQWGDCMGAVGPTPEICDGIDNDCDGIIDNVPVSVGDGSPNGLCGPNLVCQNGTCVAPPTGATPSGDSGLGPISGCNCRTGTGSSGPPSDLLLFGLALLVARRRRR